MFGWTMRWANEPKKQKSRKHIRENVRWLFASLSVSSQHILCMLLSSCVDNDISFRIDNVRESSTPKKTPFWRSHSRFVFSVLIMVNGANRTNQ